MFSDPIKRPVEMWDVQATRGISVMSSDQCPNMEGKKNMLRGVPQCWVLIHEGKPCCVVPV